MPLFFLLDEPQNNANPKNALGGSSRFWATGWKSLLFVGMPLRRIAGNSFNLLWKTWRSEPTRLAA
jgi:hypothetical protein